MPSSRHDPAPLRFRRAPGTGAAGHDRTAGRTPRFLALAGAVTAIVLAFFFVVRPWYRQWGATEGEARGPLPGDEIVPNAAGQETRAITIHASVDRVWPWLAQLGQDRGGFYSYDLLENLVGCEMPTVDRLRPKQQSWRIGDKLWMYPPERASGVGFATLRAHVPGRALAFGTHMPGSPASVEDGSWAFVLVPLGDSATRFLVRGRGAPGRSLLGVAFDQSVFEPMHFVMERRTMLGLKALAEGGDRGRIANHVHILLWTITFALFITAVVLVFHRRRWLLPLAGVVAAAVVFQVLTLAQPPLALAVLLVAAVGVLVGYAWKGAGEGRSPLQLERSGLLL